MENSDPDKNPKEDEVNLPPINLPSPDEFDTRRSNEGRNSFTKRSQDSKKKKRRKKQRSHPTDVYQDVRREKKGGGCCGTIGCLFVLFVLIVGGIGTYAAYIVFDPVKEGFNLVRLNEPEVQIGVAPKEPTLFLGPLSNVTYNAAYTEVPVGIIAKNVEVSGIFLGDVTIRGIDVTCKADSKFEKDLDIYAWKYRNEGIEVNGLIKGLANPAE